MPSANATESEIRDWCIASVARIVSDPSIAVEPEITFAQMGLDSASLAYFIVELEDWFGIELDLEVVADHPTIAAVARHLIARQGESDAGTG